MTEQTEHVHVHEWYPMVSGGIHFSDGEVWDDYREYCICACGAEVDQLPGKTQLEETEIPF